MHSTRCHPADSLINTLISINRQILTFVEIQKAPLQPAATEYIHRGSIQYEFGTELLQTPVQLLRISNVEAQVSSHTGRFL